MTETPDPTALSLDDLRGLRQQLTVRCERGLADDLRRELVDRVDALGEEREEGAEVDGAEPQQRRHQQ